MLKQFQSEDSRQREGTSLATALAWAGSLRQTRGRCNGEFDDIYGYGNGKRFRTENMNEFNIKSITRLSFLVLSSIITFFFAREFSQLFFGPTTSFVLSLTSGVFTGLIFYFTLDNKTILFRLLSLLFLTALLVIARSEIITREGHAEPTPLLTSKAAIQGEWIGQEDDVTLRLSIDSDIIEMTYYPDSLKQIYKYQLDGNVINMADLNSDDRLIWHFVLTDSGDTMRVDSDDFVFTLRRSSM